MILNIELDKKELIKIAKNSSISEYGIIYILLTYNNKGKFNLATELPQINMSDFIMLLNKLARKNIINTSMEGEVIHITNFIYKTSPLVSQSANDEMYKKIFKLNNEQLTTLKKKSLIKDKVSKEKLIYYIFNKYTFSNITKYEINSEKDYKDFLKHVTPLEILQINNKVLVIDDFIKIYDFINNYEFSLEIYSFVYDYSILTSIYKTINYNFVNKMLMSLKNSEVKTVDEAMNYIQQIKDQKIEKISKYVEPEYNNDKVYNAQDIDINDIIKGEISFE